MAEYLTIGAFSLVTSLSIVALRHYDEVGLLRPAEVDPVTGYRRYHPDQERDARLICSLRAVDLPIEHIKAVLGGRDVKRVLAEHRERLEERARQVGRMATVLDEFIEKGTPMPQVDGCRIAQVKIAVTDRQEAVSFYEQAFGVTYTENIESFQFGVYRTDGFFLLTLDGEGQGEFGFLVDDLDTVHRRVLAAGGREMYPPTEGTGMPRHSGVADPSGNRIHLYQG